MERVVFWEGMRGKGGRGAPWMGAEEAGQRGKRVILAVVMLLVMRKRRGE